MIYQYGKNNSERWKKIWSSTKGRQIFFSRPQQGEKFFLMFLPLFYGLTIFLLLQMQPTPNLFPSNQKSNEIPADDRHTFTENTKNENKKVSKTINLNSNA